MFSQPYLADTTLGYQGTRWTTLDTDKTNTKDFRPKYQNDMEIPQKGSLQKDKPEKWEGKNPEPHSLIEIEWNRICN